MLRNYLLIAWRNLRKNKAFSVITIVGLAIGMAACLCIVQYVSYELSYDTFHEKSDRIYRVSLKGWDGTSYIQDACGYSIAGQTMQKDFPEVADYAHFRMRDKCNIAFGNTAFRENKVGIASARFLHLFSFPLLKGNAQTALSAPNTIIISQITARRYFGSENPMGKVLQYNDGYYQAALTVTGVMQDMPPNSHLHADMLVSYSTTKGWNNWDFSWCCNQDYLYVLLDAKANADNLARKLPAFTRRYAQDAVKFRYELELQALKDIHLYSHKTYEIEPNGSGQAVYLLAVVGILILIIAWVNYVNLSTARATERAREVGIRKAVGSSRRQLMKQFVLEAVQVNVLAVVLAFTLFQCLLPGLETLLGKPLGQFSPPWEYRLGWIAVFAAGAILAGLYPAVLLSSFSPINALKGNMWGMHRGTGLRKGLVVAQFSITVLLLVGTLAVFKQIRFMQGKELGMNINQTLVLYTPRTASQESDSLRNYQYERLKHSLTDLSGVNSVSVVESLPGNGMYELNSSANIQRANVENPTAARYFNFGVDADFFHTLGVRLLAGRSFSVQFTDDVEKQLIINEAAAKLLGFDTPQAAIGQPLLWGNTQRVVVGVVGNYHHHSLKTGYDPFVYFWDQGYGNASYVVLKLHSGSMQANNLSETIAQVQRIWQQTFPAGPFDYFFLDERFNAQYKSELLAGQLFGWFAGLAIFVACLGLLGLMLLTTARRAKEVGIRKVLGASATHILALLTRDFSGTIVLATLLAWPLAYVGISQWLSNYAFRMSISAWLFVLPSLGVLAIALLTVSFQTLHAARANPVDSLRTE